MTSPWSRAFVVTFVFVTLAAGLFWLDFFRAYRADVTVLIVARSGMPETSSDVAENAAELVRTLAFYDRMLADNDLIDDAFDGSAPDRRKAGWNALVTVERQAESGVLVIEARGDTPEQAKRLAKQTAQSLFAVAGFYYDVKTDIDMRIIDGPLAAYVFRSPFLFAATSVLTSLALTALFFWFLRALPGFIGRRQKNALSSDVAAPTEKAYPEFASGETVPWIDPQKFVPARPRTLSFENTFPAMPPVSPLPVVRPVTYAPAPANLPTADSEEDVPLADEADFPYTSGDVSDTAPEAMFSERQDAASVFPVRGEHNIDVSSTVSDASPSVLSARERAEPSIDEYKRRLNELLSGGQ